MIDKEQDYFWTEVWQEKVKISLKDLEEGRIKSHNSMDDLIQELTSMSTLECQE